MKRLIFLICLIGWPLSVMAEIPTIVLEKAPIDRSDMASVRRGATFYAANCLSCHSLVYLRYDKLANDAGITYAKMPLKVTAWPFGVKPPDLSLETNVRGIDWVYTFLHSFYVDSSRPTGSNNLLFPNLAMPNMLGAYQGQQALAADLVSSEKTYRHAFLSGVHGYDVLQLQQQGSMTPEQFDSAVADVVNFLAYAAEPYHNDQVRIGRWVIGFLLLFFVLAYFLKQNYWKDVK